MKTLSKKEKELWNEAVRKTINEMKLYDGVIPDKVDRLAMAENIQRKISYKLKTKLPKICTPLTFSYKAFSASDFALSAVEHNGLAICERAIMDIK